LSSLSPPPFRRSVFLPLKRDIISNFPVNKSLDGLFPTPDSLFLLRAGTMDELLFKRGGIFYFILY
jgi:hypothetical protein